MRVGFRPSFFGKGTGKRVERLKKAGNFLCSMKFAILLLLILAAACMIGSVIPQGQTTAWYTMNYPETAVGAILLLGLDDIFHCWWFVGLTLFLCLNLLGCSVLRFPRMAKKQLAGFDLENCLSGWNQEPVAQTKEDPNSIFAKLGFRNIEIKTDSRNRECRYAIKNKAGIWGAWLCHVGMLVIIAGFGLGQMFQRVYTVYGVPGQTKPIGDTGYELRIDDFQVLLRADATVEQYVTSMTIAGPQTGDTRSYEGGQASVNSPLSAFGMKFYQNSTGWAATLDILKNGEKIDDVLLCAGEYARINDDLAVVLSAFYPDYYENANGMPATLTPQLNNPAYLYTLYHHDHVLGMNILAGDEVITVDDYTFRFHDPQQYTLIQIKRDPFTPLAAVGGLIVILALLLAFYLHPTEIWAVKQDDGTWAIGGRSRKGGAMLLEEIREKARGLQ